MRLFLVFRKSTFWLFLIILLGLYVRLYKIDTPLADWHSWRQSDTASVTRNFIKLGFNPFFPHFDDMSGISEKPVPNLGGFRFVEFPIYNIFVYPLYLFFGINETYHRLVSVLFSLGSIVFLYLITKKYADNFTALLSSLIFALLPYNVFFSRVILPEPTLVFFCLGMIYFADQLIVKITPRRLFLVLFFATTSFLIKPWTIFFILPLVYLIYVKHGRLWRIPIRYPLTFLIVLSPFILWRLWILQHPEGIPASSWLANGDGIRFRPAFWWWIISERMGREILGASGLVLFFIGLVMKPAKNYFFHFWVLSIFLYFIIFATGNVRHDYYQILFVPVASIFVSLGFVSLVKGNYSFIPRLWLIIIAFILLPLSFYFSFLQVRGFYQINNPSIVSAGEMADRILPTNAIVLAPYNGDTAFLYQTNRKGWPVAAYPIPELVSVYGVTHYVSTSRDDKTNWVIRHFEVLVDDPSFIIADLTKLNKPLDLIDPEP